MSSKGLLKRLSLGAVLMFVFVGLSVTSVSAHVTVKPGEVKTSTYQVFTVSVPNEKEIPTTNIRVEVPENITSVTPTKKAGWEIEVARNGEAVSSITWKGGEVPDGLRDEFTFSAKTPVEAGSVNWKAYQTYSDGSVVAWDQAELGDGHGDESKGPFSVTSVVVNTDNEAVDSQQVSEANNKADRANYIAIAAVVVALIALFFATRKSRS